MRRINWLARRAVLMVAATLVASTGAEPVSAQFSPETISARQKYFGLDNVDPATGAVRGDRVITSWQGMSNLAASFNGHVVLLNAWLSRSPNPAAARPSMPGASYTGSTPDELAALAPAAIFFGHGHGDHSGDMPVVIRANPGITVLGAAEHCSDLKAAVTDVEFTCISVFPEGAPLGTTTDVDDLLPGVEITAIKQPHSNGSTVSETNLGIPWLLGNPQGNCTPFDTYPVSADEPVTWSAPTSGSITAMWQFRVGEFALVWQDTAGPLAGTGVPEALASLPQTDVRMASIVVAGVNTIGEHLSILRPKLFVPLHHDPCGYLHRPQFDAYMDTVPDEIRPLVWFLSDPSDYLRPMVFDPSAPIWID